MAITLVGCGSGSANPSPATGGTSASDPLTDDSTVTGAVGLRADDIAVVTTPPTVSSSGSNSAGTAS
jgi:hypothetical protein